MSRDLLNIVKSQILEKIETLKEAKSEIQTQTNVYIYNQKRERFDSLYAEFETLLNDRLQEIKAEHEEVEDETNSSISEPELDENGDDDSKKKVSPEEADLIFNELRKQGLVIQEFVSRLIFNQDHVEEKTQEEEQLVIQSQEMSEEEPEETEREEDEEEMEGNLKVEKNKEMEEALFAEIFEIEKGNLDLIKDLNTQAEGILQVATAMNNKIAAQNEQMAEIQKENEELQDTSKRALKEVKNYLGQASKDKLLFLCVSCCGCVCIVILCVLLVIPFLKPVTCLVVNTCVSLGVWTETPDFLAPKSPKICDKVYQNKEMEPTTTGLVYLMNIYHRFETTRLDYDDFIPIRTLVYLTGVLFEKSLKSFVNVHKRIT